MTETMTEPKYKPIPFTAPMVRAILEGRKTQTRRIVKPVKNFEQYDVCSPDQAYYPWDVWWHKDPGLCVGVMQSCPYGKPGDRLWVKETYKFNPGGPIYDAAGGVMDSMDDELIYRADRPNLKAKWTSGRIMPRWASRITLEVTGVRVERLQDISGEDCWAEGIWCAGWDSEKYGSVTHCYRDLWESINGSGAWDKNPWVWVIEFKRVGEK